MVRDLAKISGRSRSSCGEVLQDEGFLLPECPRICAISMLSFWSSGGRVVKLLACGARGPEFDSPPRHLNFRDWLSPASKSRYG